MNKNNISKIAQDVIDDYNKEEIEPIEDSDEVIEIAKETLPSTPLIRSISLR